MLDYVLWGPQKFGVPNETVEIDERKFHWRKCNREQKLKGQCFFGGVDSVSRKGISICVPNRTANTLVAVLHNWNEPGTTVISDCSPRYRTEKRMLTNTKLWITRSVSLMCLLPLVRAQSRVPGGMWKHFLIHRAGWGTNSFVWRATCLRRAAESRKLPI